MREIFGQLKAIDLKGIDLRGIDVKRVGTAAATLVVALGAGYYMQSEQADRAADHALAPAPVQTASVLPGFDTPASSEDASIQEVTQVEPVAAMDDTLAAPPEISTDQSGEVDPMKSQQFELAALDVEAETEAPLPSVPTETVEIDQCAPKLTGVAGKMAMVNVTVHAPCQPNAEIEFSHAGLVFSEYLDADGKVQIDVPALQQEALITASFKDDAAAQIKVTVPDASQYRRAVLVWHGATGLQLHAFEEGANYGEEGHIWADHPGGQSRVTSGKGGFATVLGSVADGYAADVYTFPAYMMRSVSGPAISIEAQVMEATCKDAIEGVFLRANGKDDPRTLPVQMASPGCEAIGEYLVLQDMPQELRIALN